jgi:hypothetical protein
MLLKKHAAEWRPQQTVQYFLHTVSRSTLSLHMRIDVNPRAINAVIKLGGPDALSPLEVVRLAEEVAGKRFVVQHVPEEALRAQYGAALDPLQQSFAALMLYYARGHAIDTAETLRTLPVQHWKSVREYLQVTV